MTFANWMNMKIDPIVFLLCVSSITRNIYLVSLGIQVSSLVKCLLLYLFGFFNSYRQKNVSFWQLYVLGIHFHRMTCLFTFFEFLFCGQKSSLWKVTFINSSIYNQLPSVLLHNFLPALKFRRNVLSYYIKVIKYGVDFCMWEEVEIQVYFSHVYTIAPTVFTEVAPF